MVRADRSLSAANKMCADREFACASGAFGVTIGLRRAITEQWRKLLIVVKQLKDGPRGRVPDSGFALGARRNFRTAKNVTASRARAAVRAPIGRVPVTPAGAVAESFASIASITKRQRLALSSRR